MDYVRFGCVNLIKKRIVHIEPHLQQEKQNERLHYHIHFATEICRKYFGHAGVLCVLIANSCQRRIILLTTQGHDVQVEDCLGQSPNLSDKVSLATLTWRTKIRTTNDKSLLLQD